jgi:DMSO/TMAO reductase YedYZ molybdopterin-dependent catalytic subunit
LLVDAGALAALEVLKAQVVELLAAGEIVLDNDTAYPQDGGWRQSAYSEYGSAASEEETRLMEQRHRQEGY